jgi:hypothetical protein
MHVEFNRTCHAFKIQIRNRLSQFIIDLYWKESQGYNNRKKYAFVKRKWKTKIYFSIVKCYYKLHLYYTTCVSWSFNFYTTEGDTDFKFVII